MTDDQIQQLERLASLRASGALTEEEYAAAKARVLAASPDLGAPAAPWSSELAASIPSSAPSSEAPGPVPPPPPVETPGFAASPPPPSAVTYAQGRWEAGKWIPAPIFASRDDLRAQGLYFKRYPAWVMVLLTVFTLGVFAVFWLNHWHGVMPKRRTDDPSTARAIGFLFIPLFNLYWVFESHLRLCTRLDEELIDAGIPDRVPREMVRWSLILNFIPYFGPLVHLVMSCIVVGQMQSLVNQLADVDAEWYASKYGSPVTAG